MIDAKFTLEMQKNGVQKTVHVKSGETNGARRLLITLTNNGAVVPLEDKTVACFKRTDSTTTLLENAATVDDNVIVFTIPSLAPGEHFIEFAVQDEELAEIEAEVDRRMIEKDEEVVSLNNQIAELTQQRDKLLNSESANRDEITKLNNRIGILENKLERRRKQVASLSGKLKRRDAKIENLSEKARAGRIAERRAGKIKAPGYIDCDRELFSDDAVY